jgi:DNA-binding response OmpR family regulator
MEGKSMARILIAEDAPDIGEVLTIGLSQQGFDTVAANDGPSALAKALQGGIDLAILDIRMPGMDGVEVLRQLRAEGRTYPVILLTANITPAEKTRGYAAGASAYIIKPFRLTEVVSEVRALLPSA